MKYAIVVVGYNRPKSMERLLISLEKALYHKSCDLIISLDYSDIQDKLIEISNKINWINGEKKIRIFKEKQGLRQHILHCGDLTNEYDAVIVLEDDLVVAEGFFQYVYEAVEFYKDDEKIAGISLYTHRTNPGNGRPFEAQNNGKDVFLMQYAMSWGQCWTKRMWYDFRKWYDKNQEIARDGVIPDYIVNWNKQSWLKYYIRYTAEKKLYYVYPYFSLTTNSSEVGEHNDKNDSAYQVPLSFGSIKEYRFSKVEDAIKYDSYFERILENNFLNNKKVLLDLYGLRRVFFDAEVLVSTQKLNYKILNKLELKYRPHEVNYFIFEEGKGIFVYDLSEEKINTNRSNKLSIVSYDVKAESARLTLIHGFYGLKEKLLHFFKR